MRSRVILCGAGFTVTSVLTTTETPETKSIYKYLLLYVISAEFGYRPGKPYTCKYFDTKRSSN